MLDECTDRAGNLGIVVVSVGRPSETYIASHIDGILPEYTQVCSLRIHPEPAWFPKHPVVLLGSSGRSSRLLTTANLWAPGFMSKIQDLRLMKWMVWQEIKVVFCEYLQVASMVFDVCARQGVPVLAHAHGYDVSAAARDKQLAQQYERILPHLAGVVVVSEHMKRRVMDFGVREERVSVIPCGVAISGETTFDTTVVPNRLVAVGRLIEKKGPIFLLEAFRRIRLAVPDAELVIIGEGELEAAMRHFVEAASLVNSVRFLGRQSHATVKSWLRTGSVFVQHSVTGLDGDEEGLPVSILEAMAEGLPVVSTRHAGIPEAVVDSVTGFLVEEKDSEGMAARCVTLLQDPELAKSLGATGRRIAQQRFGMEQELSRLRRLVLSCWEPPANRSL